MYTRMSICLCLCFRVLHFMFLSSTIVLCPVGERGVHSEGSGEGEVMDGGESECMEAMREGGGVRMGEGVRKEGRGNVEGIEGGRRVRREMGRLYA